MRTHISSNMYFPPKGMECDIIIGEEGMPEGLPGQQCSGNLRNNNGRA